MKQQILSAINGRIRDLQKTVDRAQSLMQQNFNHFFCYESKETYKAYYLLEKYTQLLKEVEDTANTEELIEFMRNSAGFYLRQLTDQKLYAATTNQMVNLSRSFEMEAAQILYKFHRHFIGKN